MAANRPKSGRPPKADEAYVKLLEQVIDQDPQELGYDFSIWTAGRLRLHMQKETGIELGSTQFRVLLKENDFVYRRPKHDLTNLQDASARQAAEEWLEELKKVPKKERSTYSLWTKAP
jgi:transposase